MERIAKLALEAFNGGSANGYGGKFNLRMPVGTTIREIFLTLGNLNIDQVTRISLTLNGDEFYRTTGEKLDKLRKSLGLHTDDNTIVIPFTDVSQKLVQDQNYSELVVLPNENLVMHVDTAAAESPAQDGLVASITARAHFATKPRVNPATGKWVRVRLPRLFDEILSGNTTEANKYRGLLTQNKSGNGTRLQRMFLKSDRVDNLRIRRNKIEIHDANKADNLFDLQALGLTQQADEYFYTAVDSGFAVADALNIVNDFEYEVDLSAVGDFEALYQGVEILASPVEA